MSTSACAGMYAMQVFLTSVYIFETHPRQGVHMHSCMRSLFISVWARRCVGSASLVGHLLLAWDIIIHMRKDTGFVCISPFFDGVGVYVGVCVCIRAHTHTLTYTPNPSKIRNKLQTKPLFHHVNINISRYQQVPCTD